MGLVGFEPTTPRLSSVCSDQLSYRPRTQDPDQGWRARGEARNPPNPKSSVFDPAFQQPIRVDTWPREQFSRKEVIQPHLPIRLPCYDFTPVMNLTVVVAPLAVRLTTSGGTHSHGVTGGVYKTRERIHRDMLIHDY